MKNGDNITTKERPQGIPFPGDLRDWFAGMALQGLLATDTPDYEYDGTKELAAKMAYRISDHMLKERSR